MKKTEKTGSNHLSAPDLLRDILSGEYINDLIYGHPERLSELQPLFKLAQININPHIVLTIVPDHFWRLCEKKDNAYRYQLKRNMLNSTRKIMKSKMKGVAATLIGTDKVVVLLDCENYTDESAERYAECCAAQIQAAVQKRTGLSASVGVSKYCASPTLLWKAYEQSFRALENSFQIGDGQIIAYRQPASAITGKLGKQEQELIKRELILAVSTQNKENCVHALNSLTAKLAIENASEAYAKSLMVITLSELARHCIMIGLNSSEISEKVVTNVNDIFKADTMDDVKKEALSFLSFLICRMKNGSTDISILNIAKAYIQQYYMNTLTLRDVADLCGYSTAYFSRSFKEYFGINFVQYLNQVRIENAKKLLAESELSAAEICEKTGYQSLSYFSTSFKKETGLAPQQYRAESQSAFGSSRKKIL